MKTNFLKKHDPNKTRPGYDDLLDTFRKKLTETKKASDSDTEYYDIIVVGIGSMGASAMYHLAKRGAKVLGIEQFNVVHKKGSHSGQSRLIRKAYFEHPDYVPLLQRSYTNWKAIEAETGRQLYFPTGLVYLGDRNGDLLKSVTSSADKYNINVIEYSEEQIKEKLPWFTVPQEKKVLFEPDAGFISPEKTILTYAEKAVDYGAEINEQEEVLDWSIDKELVEVTTTKNKYKARKLILTAGAYTHELLPDYSDKLTVTRQLMMWLKPENKEVFLDSDFPCWVIEEEEFPGVFYGFPYLFGEEFPAPEGLKIAHHYQAEKITPKELEAFDGELEKEKLLGMIRKYLPEAEGELIDIKSCMYTNSPDDDFIIDRLRGYEDYVTFACGFSGHGFKFVPVAGEILADLSLEGKTKLPIDFLSSKRFE